MNAHDQAVIDQLSRKLDLIEQTVPMVDSYARIDPYIIDKSEGDVNIRFVVYHRESKDWYDNNNIDHACMSVRKLDLVKPDDVAFDLGCNSGYLTAWMGKMMPRGHVHAFDPYPWNTAAVEAQAAINGLRNIYAYTVGLGKVRRSITTDATSSKTFNAPGARDDYKITLKIETPQSYLRFSPTFVKVDIEGAEHELTETNLLSHWSVQRGYVEMHSGFIKEGGGDPADFLSGLVANDYTVFGPDLRPTQTFPDIGESAFYFQRPPRQQPTFMGNMGDLLRRKWTGLTN